MAQDHVRRLSKRPGRLENPPHMSLVSSEAEMTFDRGQACLSESFYADTQGYLTISFMYYMKESFTAGKL